MRCCLKLGYRIVNLDKLTYAGNLASLRDVENDSSYKFVHGDIADINLVRNVIAEEQPSGILNLAAETHVDRSIDAPDDFIQTNIVGTYKLLKAALEYWSNLDSFAKEAFRFLHVSTDEVFGSLGSEGYFINQKIRWHVGDEEVAEMDWRIMKFLPANKQGKEAAETGSIPADLDPDKLMRPSSSRTATR